MAARRCVTQPVLHRVSPRRQREDALHGRSRLQNLAKGIASKSVSRSRAVGRQALSDLDAKESGPVFVQLN